MADPKSSPQAQTPKPSPQAQTQRNGRFPPGELSRIWSWLGRRLRDRDDSEHEQSLIRIVMILIMFAYMMTYPHPGRAGG